MSILDKERDQYFHMYFLEIYSVFTCQQMPYITCHLHLLIESIIMFRSVVVMCASLDFLTKTQHLFVKQFSLAKAEKEPPEENKK